jgi:hypothetical protein
MVFQQDYFGVKIWGIDRARQFAEKPSQGPVNTLVFGLILFNDV